MKLIRFIVLVTANDEIDNKLVQNYIKNSLQETSCITEVYEDHSLHLSNDEYLAQEKRMLNATRRGYFWLPCPRCGRMFGGNEIVGSLDNPAKLGSGWCTCCEP